MGVKRTRSEEPDFSLAKNWPHSLKELVGATPESIKEYFSIFLSPTMPTGVSYTYGNRLMAYPNPSGKHPIDQIEEILKKNLIDSPDSRRCSHDNGTDSRQRQQRTALHHSNSSDSERGQTSLLVTARSHDIFKSAIPNAFGLRTLQKKITRELGFELGELQITSQSAHIYEQDWDQAFKTFQMLLLGKKTEPDI